MIWLLILQASWVAYLLVKQRRRWAMVMAGAWAFSYLPVFAGLSFAELWLGHFKAPSLLAAAMPWFVNRMPAKLTVLSVGTLIYAGFLGISWIPVLSISHGEPALGLMLAVAIIAIISQSQLVMTMALVSMIAVTQGIMVFALWLDVWLWLWCAATLPIDLIKRYWGKSTSKPA